jgi:hypothetical protein
MTLPTGYDPTTGVFILPLWAAGLTVALFAVCGVLAYIRTGRERLAAGLAPAALVLVGVGASFFFLDGGPGRDLSAERRALDARAQELLMRAALPNSPLACLDTYAGEAVEASCEKSLFATPESVAAALSYVSAQLSLLSDFTDHVRRARSGEPLAIVNLRRSIEGDRFGLVAQVLTVRDGCIPNDCLALASLHDPSRIGTNLAEGAFDFFVARHVAAWPTGGARPPGAGMVASPGGTTPGGATLAGASSTTPVATTRPGNRGGELFFPSSSSIPPVNIMNAEPATTGQSSDGTPSAKQTPRSTARRPPPRPAARPSQPIDLNAAARSGGSVISAQ